MAFDEFFADLEGSIRRDNFKRENVLKTDSNGGGTTASILNLNGISAESNVMDDIRQIRKSLSRLAQKSDTEKLERVLDLNGITFESDFENRLTKIFDHLDDKANSYYVESVRLYFEETGNALAADIQRQLDELKEGLKLKIDLDTLENCLDERLQSSRKAFPHYKHLDKFYGRHEHRKEKKRAKNEHKHQHLRIDDVESVLARNGLTNKTNILRELQTLKQSLDNKADNAQLLRMKEGVSKLWEERADSRQHRKHHFRHALPVAFAMLLIFLVVRVFMRRFRRCVRKDCMRKKLHERREDRERRKAAKRCRANRGTGVPLTEEQMAEAAASLRAVRDPLHRAAGASNASPDAAENPPAERVSVGNIVEQAEDDWDYESIELFMLGSSSLFATSSTASAPVADMSATDAEVPPVDREEVEGAHQGEVEEEEEQQEPASLEGLMLQHPTLTQFQSYVTARDMDFLDAPMAEKVVFEYAMSDGKATMLAEAIEKQVLALMTKQQLAGGGKPPLGKFKSEESTFSSSQSTNYSLSDSSSSVSLESVRDLIRREMAAELHSIRKAIRRDIEELKELREAVDGVFVTTVETDSVAEEE